MASYNKVTLVGNLGADPELQVTQTGLAICKLRMATTEKWTTDSGEKKERTDWHQIVSFGKQGENIAKFLSKGSACLVEGKLQTDQYEKDGEKRYATKVVAQNVVFLGSPNGERTNSSASNPAPKQGWGAQPPQQQQAGGAVGYGDDDFANGDADSIPF